MATAAVARREPTGPASGPPRAVTDRHAHRGLAIAVAVASAGAVWAVWAVFARTVTGRLVDDAAWEGALKGQNRLWQLAEPVLDLISVPFIIGVLVAAMLLAVVRRRVLLAFQVAFLIGGSNLTTQLLKHGVLDRPDLGLGDSLRTTLPSGHTTAAASVAAALLLVVPRRLRPAVAVLGACYAAATGVSTLVGRWHRPSDAAAAVLVVLAWAGIVNAIGTRVAAPDDGRRTAAVAGFLGLAGLASGIGAGLALQRSIAASDDGGTSTAELLTAYAGGALGVVCVVMCAFAVMLIMVRAVEARPA
jgi:membrane-associated phospholipid phosphatase